MLLGSICVTGIVLSADGLFTNIVMDTCFSLGSILVYYISIRFAFASVF